MNMAEILCLNLKTVGICRANPISRLDVQNASGLTASAMERGLFF